MKLDWQLILELAGLSQRAYRHATWLSTATGASFLIEHDDHSIRVAFKGSSTPKDFIEDGRFWQTRTWGGAVHTGFHDDCSSLLPQLFAGIKKRLGEHDRPLYITGHSLGGAQAPLAAETLFRQSTGRIAGVYTFGEPRVFDSHGARSYNRLLGDRTVRIANEGDLVPHVPVPDLIFRYWHHQAKVLLRADGGFVAGQGRAWQIIENVRKHWQARRAGKGTGLWGEIKTHHAIETYIDNIRRIASLPYEPPAKPFRLH